MPLILQRLLPRVPFFGSFHASSTSQPSARALHPAWVVLWISVWMAAVCNVPLWREVLHLPGNTGVRGWAFLAAFMVLGKDLLSKEGVMLLSAGHVLSADMISRIRKYAMAEGLNLALDIRMPG